MRWPQIELACAVVYSSLSLCLVDLLLTLLFLLCVCVLLVGWLGCDVTDLGGSSFRHARFIQYWAGFQSAIA
jgi:TRAP-type mannitol/chloroaromatic compound transport system permease small subunit